MRSPEDQCHCHRADTMEGTLAPKLAALVGPGLCRPRPLSLLHSRSVSPSAPSHVLHSFTWPASDSHRSCFLEANPYQSLCSRHQVCCSVISVKLKCIPTAYLMSVTSVKPSCIQHLLSIHQGHAIYQALSVFFRTSFTVPF